MNKVIYDWLTFTTKKHSLSGIVSFLGLDGIKFENLKGRYCYQDRLYYDGINILYNGRENMGICVEMSGQGCRAFETYGNGNYKAVFDFIKENYNADPDKRFANITRLDVAYDDFEGILDLKYLMMAAQKGEYVSRLKDIEVIYSNKGCSVCHGSRHYSNFYVRIYDKKMERGRDDLDHWVRCEIKLKDDIAFGFIKLDGDIRENYFDVLNNYLRYILPTEDSNKRRASVSPEWLNFVESWDNVSVFDKPGTEYNMSNLYGYVVNQLACAIKTCIDVIGVDDFLKDIYDVASQSSLNPKYQKIASEYSEHENSVLNYLKEHLQNETEGDPRGVFQ